MGYSPDIHANPPDFIVWMARAVQDGNSAFLQAIVLQACVMPAVAGFTRPPPWAHDGMGVASPHPGA
jgi:hypothetical protein